VTLKGGGSKFFLNDFNAFVRKKSCVRPGFKRHFTPNSFHSLLSFENNYFWKWNVTWGWDARKVAKSVTNGNKESLKLIDVLTFLYLRSTLFFFPSFRLFRRPCDFSIFNLTWKQFYTIIRILLWFYNNN